MKTEDGFDLPDGKLPYPVRPGDAPFRSLERLIDSSVGQSLMEAKREIRSHAVHELELLDSLHQDLVRRAQAIIEKAKRDLELHDVPMFGAKIRGKCYYRYRKTNGDPSDFFSILEPSEYRQADADAEFLGAYRLNEDSSWTVIDNSDKQASAI